MKKYSNCSGKNITLDIQLGKGAGGTIYSIKGTNKVAKVIHTHLITPQMAVTITVMVQAFKSGYVTNTMQWDDGSVTQVFTWPEELLYFNGKFCGFIREDIGSNKEFIDLGVIIRDSYYGNEDWKPFSKDKNKHILAQRIAIVFSKFFSNRKYQNGDIKPQNIMVNKKGFPTIIDIDNISIRTNNGWIHPCKKMGTPNYMSPDWSEKPKDLYSDYFSIAIIIYELFFFIHPYDGTSQQEMRRHDAIKANLYVDGPNRSQYIKIPPEHSKLNLLPKEFRTLFRRAFSLNTKGRPTPEEWAFLLTNYLTPSFSQRSKYKFLKYVKVLQQKFTNNRIQFKIPKISISISLRNLIKSFQKYQIRSHEYINDWDSDLIAGIYISCCVFNLISLWLVFDLFDLSGSKMIMGYLYWIFLYLYGFLSTRFKFDWMIVLMLGPLSLFFGFFKFFTVAYAISTIIYFVYGTFYLFLKPPNNIQ